MKKIVLFSGGVVAAMCLAATAADANPILVSTINGCYDCHVYDTPSLEITNNTAYDFTNVALTLTGYQGSNNGVTQSRSLPDIAAGSNPYIYNWSDPTTAGNLFSYDYDDSNGVYYNQVGNFYVTFTAKWNGNDIYSQFSPDPNNPSGIGNAAGVFVGWLGLDPNGFAETSYDAHNGGGPNGVLANIYIGTPPDAAVPEPGSILLLGSGLLAAYGVRRKLAA